MVGDPAQSSWPDVAESQQAITALIGGAPSRTFRLSTNYRSPAEVFDLAARVIVRAFPDADLPIAVRSTGIDPQLVVAPGHELAASVRDTVVGLLTTVEGTVGVIVPAGRYDTVAAAVASVGDERVSVLTPLEVKGLEHDGVVVHLAQADGVARPRRWRAWRGRAWSR